MAARILSCLIELVIAEGKWPVRLPARIVGRRRDSAGRTGRQPFGPLLPLSRCDISVIRELSLESGALAVSAAAGTPARRAGYLHAGRPDSPEGDRK
jgi:hypothetical protein